MNADNELGRLYLLINYYEGKYQETIQEDKKFEEAKAIYLRIEKLIKSADNLIAKPEIMFNAH